MYVLLIFFVKFDSVLLVMLPTEVVSKYDLIPWVGLLRYSIGTKRAYTGITLISEQYAIGVASELATLDPRNIRTTCRAKFYAPRYVSKYREVLQVTLYPHRTNVVNHPALLLLEAHNNTHYLRPVQLFNLPGPQYKYTYRIGFTDRHGVFEQVAHRMVYVKPSQCQIFYEKKQLDIKSIWPENTTCFRDQFNKKPCIGEAGMALATIDNHKWTLLGLSILGPSCASPSRYIVLEPYLPWLTEIVGKDTRRKSRFENVLLPYSIHDDWDSIYLYKINDDTIVIRPWRNLTVQEGECSRSDGVIMYREAGNYSLPSPGVLLYMLSHLDTMFSKYECVMVNFDGPGRSEFKFWMDWGLHQNDVDQFVKRIPIRIRGATEPPRIVHVQDHWNKYRRMRTAHLMFRFYIERTASLEILFYGIKTEKPKPPHVTDKTPVRRDPLPYRSRFRPTPSTTTTTTTTPSTTLTTKSTTTRAQYLREILHIKSLPTTGHKITTPKTALPTSVSSISKVTRTTSNLNSTHSNLFKISEH